MRSRLVPLAGVLMMATATLLAAVTVISGAGSGSGAVLSIDRAVGIAQQVAASYPGHSLVVDEVIEFQDNFYASLRERDSGIGAFEILIDRHSGAVRPEPGPNMMWNTAYGMSARGGMMGVGAQPNGAMTVSSGHAASTAQSWLDSNLKGAAARKADTFHGYYTVDFEKAGTLAGMLSVNGYNGQVWLHTWHGDYIQSKDLGQ